MGTEFTPTEWIWKNGELVRWDEAHIHVMSHVVHYGSSVFEGIRCYETPDGPSIFRLDAHLRRFLDSCRIHRMELGYDRGRLAGACRKLVTRNGLQGCYIRPLALRGYGAAGLDPRTSPMEVFVICWPWGAYLGDGVLRTPAVNGTLLEGITRDSILRLARAMEIPAREEPVPRESLYTADEVFFTGTAAEVTPVRSVDRIQVGEGKPGPVTRKLQEALLEIARGHRADPFGWRTPCLRPAPSGGRP